MCTTARALADNGLAVSVLNVPVIKPLDADTVVAAAINFRRTACSSGSLDLDLLLGLLRLRLLRKRHRQHTFF